VRVLESRSRPDRPIRQDRRSLLALAHKHAGLCRLGRPLDGHVVGARAAWLPSIAPPARSDEWIGFQQLLKAFSLNPRDTMVCEYLSYCRLRRADVLGAQKLLQRCRVLGATPSVATPQQALEAAHAAFMSSPSSNLPARCPSVACHPVCASATVPEPLAPRSAPTCAPQEGSTRR
jgi:hypothetical protein